MCGGFRGFAGSLDKVGETTITVLLDSVASRANRAELALRDGWERGELSFPVPYVDLSNDSGLTHYDKLTVLEAPHRIADAIFRDSLRGCSDFANPLYRRLRALGESCQDLASGLGMDA